MTNCRDIPSAALTAPSCCVHRATAYRRVKRALDFVFAFVGLLLLALPLLIIAVAIKLDSDGPVLFHQRRIGKDGRVFFICKFRTMYCSAPSETATGELDSAYSYITKTGAFLRKTSLDELPQLFNVLRGDMSLVGPRPLIISESAIHELRRVEGVYSVRPGITGWAQVNGRDNITIAEKVSLDAEYVEFLSFSFDLKVFLRTIKVVFTGEGFVEGRQKPLRKQEKPHEDTVKETATPAA